MAPIPAARAELVSPPAANGRAALCSRFRSQARQRRKQLLTMLAAADEAVSTTELTERLSAAEEADVVIEVVYRNLQVLAHQGKVRRIRTVGKAVRWELNRDAGARGQSPGGPRP